MNSEALGVIGLIVGGVGTGIAIISILVALYFWSHESPRLQSQRKVEQEAEREQRASDRWADRQFMRQELEAFVLRVQGESWKESHPGKTIPKPTIAKFSQVAALTSSSLLYYPVMPLVGVMPTTDQGTRLPDAGVTRPRIIPGPDQEPVRDFIHTDVRKFYQIAQESIAFIRKDLKERIRPTSGGGFSSKVDPESRGMKASFTAIVFSGVFLEAVLHQLLVERKSINVAKKLDRETYEVKLKTLGCEDASIITLCKKYAESRREIVHEKAYFEDSHRLPPIAQVEAEAAISLIEKVIDFFGIREKYALTPAAST